VNSSPPSQPPRPSGPRPPSSPPRPQRPIRPIPPKPTRGSADAERLYSIPQVAELWGCTRQHVYNVLASGELTTTDIARPGAKRSKTRVPASALDDYAARRAAPVRRLRAV
jgi:hypothetical protein